MKILKHPMVLAVTNELLLTMKKGKAIVSLLWHDLIWSKLFPQQCNFEYHWDWMSLTLQGPISQSFQFFLASAHCSSPFLESTIWHSDGLIKNLCVLNSTSYIFISGSVSIFLLCRFMFFFRFAIHFSALDTWFEYLLLHELLHQCGVAWRQSACGTAQV